MVPSGSMIASSRDRELRDAMWLALIPFGAALALGLLLAPSRAAPESVPVPIVDQAALAHTVATDRDLAERAHREPLPGPVRALGSAIRELHSLEAAGADASRLGEARRRVDAALIESLAGGDGPLLALRAVQLEGFLAEVRRFEDTGTPTEELTALAGNFVRSMTTEGWCEGHRLALDEAALRTMFKEMWNAFLGFSHRPGFEPTLDEMRAVYRFFLSQRHISRPMREAIAAARRGAHSATECAAIAEAEQRGVETWVLEHVKSLAAIDPAYPADYALGIASYRHGDYGAAAAAFRRWLEGHPDGPWALRARNFLRAAADADRAE
jgi:hypothetical protein